MVCVIKPTCDVLVSEGVVLGIYESVNACCIVNDCFTPTPSIPSPIMGLVWVILQPECELAVYITYTWWPQGQWAVVLIS